MTLPLPYLEGHTWFYGRKFLVTPDVLIPRPETETIIDAAMHAGQNIINIGLAHVAPPKSDCHEVLRILDIGTGSGIIAITLALELRRSQITATDISPSALALAKQNAKNHSVQITFQQSNLLASIPSHQKFDIITANLPYVDPDWPWLDKQALAHEPASSLYAPDHGLALIKRLIQQAPAHLSPHGTLILEHDPCQLSALSEYATTHGFTSNSISPYVTTERRITDT